MHVVLIGLMGSGKSTVGRPLAARLDRPFLDNDAMLEQRTGQRARDIEAEHGIAFLHRAETEVLADALSDAKPAVIAAAAAAPLSGTPALLTDPHVVYLHADPATLAARVRAAADDYRPLLHGDIEALLRQQYADRDPRYRTIATQVVDATRPIDDVVEEIMQALGEGRT